MSIIYEPRGRAREYAALAANLYKGCTHGCVYCFAPACLHCSPDKFVCATARDDVVRLLDKDAAKLEGDECEILLCFTCDPYMAGVDTTATRQAIQSLIRHGLHFTVLTKGGTRARRDFDLLESYPHCSFGTSLCFTADADRRVWEPNAAPVQDRCDAIIVAHNSGIRTWVSIEPVIDPQQAVAVVGMMWRYVDHWKVGKLNHHPLAKTIDWRKFRTDVVRALEQVGASYYIKNDLRRA